MRVLHVIPSLSLKDGGPSFAAKAMAEALAERGMQVTVATTEGAHAPVIGDQLSVIREEPRRERAPTEQRGYKIVSFRRNFEAYKVSFGLTRWLRANITQFDLVHVHALFSFSSTMAARIARKNNVPYIVRPLGVLNQWGIRNRRRLPKLVSLRLIELPILLNSAAIHFTSAAEREEAALLDARLAKHESVVIPLPVKPAAKGDQERFLDRYPKLRGRKIILFLSRIDRKKGIELLFDAFAMVRQKNKDVALIIAGEGEESYVRELQEHARRVLETTGPQTTGPRTTDRQQKVSGQWSAVSGQGASEVIWTGHLSGEMKVAALAAADVFVLPSASENFGIAAAESLAADVPTIVSEEVALSSDIRKYDAGVVVKRDVQQLADAIGDLLSNKEKAATLVANGRRLVEERYSPEAVGKALHELYQKIIT
jgi:glycosyltransferase involved in cell wall biosynthesis